MSVYRGCFYDVLSEPKSSEIIGTSPNNIGAKWFLRYFVFVADLELWNGDTLRPNWRLWLNFWQLRDHTNIFFSLWWLITSRLNLSTVSASFRWRNTLQRWNILATLSTKKLNRFRAQINILNKLSNFWVCLLTQPLPANRLDFIHKIGKYHHTNFSWVRKGVEEINQTVFLSCECARIIVTLPLMWCSVSAIVALGLFPYDPPFCQVNIPVAFV